MTQREWVGTINYLNFGVQMNTMTKQTGTNSYHCTQNHMSNPNFNQRNLASAKTIDIKKGVDMGSVATMNHHKDVCNSTNHFNQNQIDILKNSICRGVSNEEFEMFLMACHKTQLDPFMRQIYAVKRKAKKPDGSWGETMTIQTGIDGYRLIAERTGRYAPGSEPSYVYDNNGNLLSSTAYIKKQTQDGTWHTVSASAYVDEYMQTFQDKNTGEKKPTGMWVNMPRTMLAKCAEAQALRKAFPAEMSGVYTKEEMQQAEPEIIQTVHQKITTITTEQSTELDHILDDCDPKYKIWLLDGLKRQYNIHGTMDIPANVFDKTKEAAIKNMEKYHVLQQSQISKQETVEVVNEC